MSEGERESERKWNVAFLCVNSLPGSAKRKKERCKNFNYSPPILWPPVLLLFSLHSIEIHMLYSLGVVLVSNAVFSSLSLCLSRLNMKMFCSFCC